MPDRGGAADGQRRGRAVRSATAATIALGAALSGACASTVDGAGAPAPGEVAVYRSELSASAAAEVRAEGVELCRESMASMVVMVRGFNAFVARLNAAQTYAGVGDLDEKARASLIAGADGIRPKITETSPAAVSTPARAFLASTARRDQSRTACRPEPGVERVVSHQAAPARCVRYLHAAPGHVLGHTSTVGSRHDVGRATRGLTAPSALRRWIRFVPPRCG